jgi:hypothetical protein
VLLPSYDRLLQALSIVAPSLEQILRTFSLFAVESVLEVEALRSFVDREPELHIY